MQIQLGIISHRFDSFREKIGELRTADGTLINCHKLSVSRKATEWPQTNIVLIDLDGYQSDCSSLISHLSVLPIVLVTDYPDTFDAPYWLAKGITDYLFNIESYTPIQLSALLAKSLHRFTVASAQTCVSEDMGKLTNSKIMQGSPVMASVWTLPDRNRVEFLHVTQNIDQLGINGKDLLEGTIDWPSLVPYEDRKIAYAILREAIDNDKNKYFMSYRIKTEKGGVRWLQDYGRIYRHPDGSVDYFESLIIDVTEQKANDRRYHELFLQAEQQTKELQLLDEVQTAIANKTTLDELYDSIVDTVSTILGYELVMITLIRDNRIWRGPHRGYLRDSVPTSIEMDEGLVGRAARSGQAILVEDVTKEALYYEILPDVVSNICLPFFCESQVAGVLLVERQRTRLNSRDLRFLSKVTEQISLAVENVRLHERTLADFNRAQALYEISKSIQEADNIESMLDDIIRSTRKAVSARWAIVYKFDYDNKVIESVSKTEINTTPLQELTFEQLQSGLTGWAIENQEVVLATDISTDRRENEHVRNDKHSAKQITSAIVAPLVVRGKPIGTLAVVNGEDDSVFTEEDRELVSTVANQSAAALTQHQLQKQIQHQAFHDSLTGLPNRTMLDQRLQETLKASRQNQSPIAVMFVDLDGFKHINDTLGHQAGDTMLIEVSKRLQSVIGSENTLVRLGGDEFAAIIVNIKTRSDAIQLGNQLLQSLSPSIIVGQHRLHVGASIGVSIYPEDSEQAPNLLRYADSAMYQAKAEGRNTVRSFSPALEQKANERLKLENDLRHAIEQDELFLEYQPQFSLSTQKLIGFEALLRWQHPEQGRMPPDMFIPIAEESGLIVSMGQWVMEEVCRQIMRWCAAGYPAMRIALNISAIQFERDDFIDNVNKVISGTSIQPELLEFEVTESVVMRDVSLVISKLHRLQEMGICIAIDDFGTGYSSFQYLQQLPLDALKIDRSFIAKANEREEECALIETIIALAQRLGLRTVAEGVENREQLDYLNRVGCAEAQGFYFSKPLPTNEIEKQYLHDLGNSQEKAA